jgi:hypothetical protein
MRTMADRTEWYCQQLIAGGHHLVPLRERIELWKLDMRMFYSSEQVAEHVKGALSHFRPCGVLTPLMREAITVLGLWVGAMNAPYELLYAELRLLATAPGRDEAASQ